MASEESKNQKTKKLSYEELNQAASEMSMQLQRLSQQMGLERQKHQRELESCTMFNMFKRLEFLFKVVENAPMFPADFVEGVTKEVVDLLSISKEQENKEEKPDDTNGDK